MTELRKHPQLGSTLKDLRRRVPLTQEQVAQAVTHLRAGSGNEMTSNWYAKLENRPNAYPSEEDLDHILAVLGSGRDELTRILATHDGVPGQAQTWSAAVAAPAAVSAPPAPAAVSAPPAPAAVSAPPAPAAVSAPPAPAAIPPPPPAPPVAARAMPASRGAPVAGEAPAAGGPPAGEAPAAAGSAPAALPRSRLRLRARPGKRTPAPHPRRVGADESMAGAAAPEHELVEKYRELSADNQARALAYVRSLLVRQRP